MAFLDEVQNTNTKTTPQGFGNFLNSVVDTPAQSTPVPTQSTVAPLPLNTPQVTTRVKQLFPNIPASTIGLPDKNATPDTRPTNTFWTRIGQKVLPNALQKEFGISTSQRSNKLTPMQRESGAFTLSDKNYFAKHPDQVNPIKYFRNSLLFGHSNPYSEYNNFVTGTTVNPNSSDLPNPVTTQQKISSAIGTVVGISIAQPVLDEAIGSLIVRASTKIPALAKAVESVSQAKILHPWTTGYLSHVLQSAGTGGLIGLITKNKESVAQNVLRTAGMFGAFTALVYPLQAFFIPIIKQVGEMDIQNPEIKNLLTNKDVVEKPISKTILFRNPNDSKMILKVTRKGATIIENSKENLKALGMKIRSIPRLDSTKIEIFKENPSPFKWLKDWTAGKLKVGDKIDFNEKYANAVPGEVANNPTTPETAPPTPEDLTKQAQDIVAKGGTKNEAVLHVADTVGIDKATKIVDNAVKSVGVAGVKSQNNQPTGIENSVVQVVNNKTGEKYFQTIKKGELKDFIDKIDNTSHGIAGIEQSNGNDYHLTAKTPQSMKERGFKYKGTANISEIPIRNRPVTPQVDALQKKLAEMDDQLDYTRGVVSEMPGKGLVKYVSQQTGQLPELGAKTTANRNKSTSIFAKKGDVITQEILGHELSDGGDVTIAQEHVDAYIHERNKLNNLEEEYKRLKKQLRELKAKKPTKAGKSAYDEYLSLTNSKIANLEQKISKSLTIEEARKISESIPETYKIHTIGREKLRAKILDELYGTGAKIKDRRADIVLGLPAGGKSSAVANPLAKEHGSLIIDSDMAKELLPEYRNGIGARATHQESSDIAENILRKAVENKDNVVLPLVGRNKDKMQKLVEDLYSHGYTVHIHLNEVSVETSKKRAISRFNETGRFVDPKYIESLGLQPKETYDILKTYETNTSKGNERSSQGIQKTSKGQSVSGTSTGQRKKIASYTHYNNEVTKGEKPKIVEKSTNISKQFTPYETEALKYKSAVDFVDRKQNQFFNELNKIEEKQKKVNATQVSGRSRATVIRTNIELDNLAKQHDRISTALNNTKLLEEIWAKAHNKNTTVLPVGLEEEMKILRGTKGMTAEDITKKYPNIQLKRDVPAKDIHGNKVVIPEGEKLTPYELKGNKILLQDGQTYIVSKNQFQNIDSNSIGGAPHPFAPELKGLVETIKGGSNWKGNELIDNGNVVATLIKNEDGTWSYQSDFSEGSDTFKTKKEAMDSAQAETTGTYSKGETKYSQYTLPNGKNYKEILIGAPNSTTPMSLNEYLDITDMEGGGEPGYKQYLKEFKNKEETVGANAFKSPHWDELNVLAHIRVDQRTYKGKPVTFLEELQSDWNKEGRDKGFSTGLSFEDAQKNANDYLDSLYKKYGTQDMANVLDRKATPVEKAKYYELNTLANKAGASIPNHPLLKNWQEWSIKRALLEAVANKSKYFAWINGDQTSARYNLATHLKEATWNSDANGKTIKLRAVKSFASMDFVIDKNGLVTKIEDLAPTEWKGKKLNEVLGKGLADKIMAKDSGTLSGAGLKFGGEWANNLYDKQVPNMVKDLTGADVIKMDMGLPIEGNKNNTFYILNNETGRSFNDTELSKSNIKVGESVYSGETDYVITDVLGDGKFNAIPKQTLRELGINNTEESVIKKAVKEFRALGTTFEKQFDISQPKTTQQGIELTPAVVSKIKGEALQIKTSGNKFEKPTTIIGGNEIANELKNLGSDNGGISEYTLDMVKKEDYKTENILISKLLKLDPDLNDYINNSDIRDFKGEPFKMYPVVSSSGEVFDGYNRIAQAKVNGEKDITIFRGIQNSLTPIEQSAQKAVREGETVQQFIEAQPKVFRGQEKAGTISFNKTRFQGNTEGGVFFTPDKNEAKKFGTNIIEKIQNIQNTVSIKEGNDLQAMATKKVENSIKKQIGIDDLLEQMSLGRPRAFAEFTKKPFLETGDKFGKKGELIYYKQFDNTNSQLTDIYNKAKNSAEVKLPELPQPAKPILGVAFPGADYVATFIEKDIIDTFKNQKQAIKKIWKFVKSPFVEESDTTKKASAISSSHIMDAEKYSSASWKVAEASRTWWEKVPSETRINIIDNIDRGKLAPKDFMKDYFAGTSQELANAYSKMAHAYRERMNKSFAFESNAGIKVHYITNYFPHMWDNVEKAKLVFERYSKSMPKGRFTRVRFITFIKTGYKHGLTLKTTNLEELITMREVDGYRIAQNIEIMKEFESIGLAFPEDTRGHHDYHPIETPDGNHLIVPPEVYTILNNSMFAQNMWSQKGVMPFIFKNLMRIKGIFVPIKLAVSGFHLIHITFIATSDARKEVYKRILRGSMNGGEAIKELAKATSFVSQATAIKKYGIGTAGWKGMYQADVARWWDTPMDKLQPYQRQVIQYIIDGGGTPKMSEEFLVRSRDAMRKAVIEGNYIGATIRGIPKIVEGYQKPIFESYIPALKVASYLQSVDELIKRKPELATDNVARRVAFRELWKSVDNRFGQMNYKTLFWKPMVKQWMQVSFLSLGWNLGFVREFGGGSLDIPKLMVRGVMRKSTKDDLTDKMLFSLDYVLQAVIVGGLMTYAMTGNRPKTLQDFFFPRTGGVNPDGSPARVNTSFYTREYFSLVDHYRKQGAVGGMTSLVENKMNPVLSTMAEIYNNKDYYGYQIRDTNSPAMVQSAQFLDYMLKNALAPISISGAIRASSVSGKKGVVLSFLGFNPAPKYIAENEIESKIYATLDKRTGGVKPLAQRIVSDSKANIRNLYLQGKIKEARIALKNAIKAGYISPRGRTRFIRNLDIPSDVRAFGDLAQFKGDQQYLLSIMTEKQLQRYAGHASSKIKPLISTFSPTAKKFVHDLKSGKIRLARFKRGKQI